MAKLYINARQHEISVARVELSHGYNIDIRHNYSRGSFICYCSTLLYHGPNGRSFLHIALVSAWFRNEIS